MFHDSQFFFRGNGQEDGEHDARAVSLNRDSPGCWECYGTLRLDTKKKVGLAGHRAPSRRAAAPPRREVREVDGLNLGINGGFELPQVVGGCRGRP